MSRPLLLDLCCCEGGASAGYSRAGFDVVGVDVVDRPRYPFPFVQADAVDFLDQHGHRFDAVAASPPCQRFTKGAKRWKTTEDHPDLIDPIREILVGLGVPWVIENVPEAPLRKPLILCGTMFGLVVEWKGVTRELRRHRGFESNVDLAAPGPCRHEHQTVSVHGNPGGSSRRDGISFPNTAAWREVMAMPWATGKAIAEAIPPSYTEHVGRQLLAAL